MNEEIKILERIIAEDGDCSFADGETCKKCPLSKLKKKDNGYFYSCVEALNIDQLPIEEHDKKYKETAKRLLLDMGVEDMLKDDSAK